MKVSSSFSFTALLNGTTINGHAAVVNGPLVQRYNRTTGTYVPDFAAMADNVKPFVYAHLNRSDTGAVVTPVSVEFRYNGVLLTFDAGGACTNIGLEAIFKKATKQVTVGASTYQMPALVVIGNLYSSSNVDNDLITISGTVEIAGQSVPFSAVKQNVVIGEMEGNQYDVYISADGDIYLTEASQNVTLEAKAMLNGALMTDLAGYSFKYYKVSGSGETLIGSTQSKTISVADVDSQLDVRVDLIKGASILASSFITIYDATDPFIVRVDITGVSGDMIGEGQTAVVTPHVVKKSTGEIHKEGGSEVYNSFAFNIQDNAGAAFLLTGRPTASFTAASASISYADIVRAGGGINGYISVG